MASLVFELSSKLLGHLLDGAVAARVGPVAVGLDARPPLAVVEEGRRDAVARVETIRAHLADLGASPRRAAGETRAARESAYDAAKSLLRDLWEALVGWAPPRRAFVSGASSGLRAFAAAWARDALARRRQNGAVAAEADADGAERPADRD